MCDRPLLFACRKWKPGQPDNWGHGHEIGEDCAGLIHEGLWNDFSCEDLISYICEKKLEPCMYIPLFLPGPQVSSKWCPNTVPHLYFCSEIYWIIVTPWKWACSEQLEFLHVSLDHGGEHMRSQYGENKGTILKWAHRLWQQMSLQVLKGCLSPPKSTQSNFTSMCNTAGQSIKDGGLLFFKVPTDLYIKSIFMFFKYIL